MMDDRHIQWRKSNARIVQKLRDEGRWGEAKLYEGIFSGMRMPVELPRELIDDLEPLRQRLIRENFPR